MCLFIELDLKKNCVDRKEHRELWLIPEKTGTVLNMKNMKNVKNWSALMVTGGIGFQQFLSIVCTHDQVERGRTRVS